MTHIEDLRRKTLEQYGEFLGEMASLWLPDACQYCPAYIDCLRSSVNCKCPAAFTEWLQGYSILRRDTQNIRVLKRMAPRLLARWLGQHMAAPIASAGNCSDCPAYEQCVEGDGASSCKEAFYRWLNSKIPKGGSTNANES